METLSSPQASISRRNPEKYIEARPLKSLNGVGNIDDAELQSLLDDPFPANNTSNLRVDEQYIGFDNSTGDTWIYPSNMPCRSYQLNITQAALYRNTLVVLPTGLGKTFIAAVVMYNLYRWYPRGKVIFMAPTRPLVNQQIEACQNIMPFPIKETVELTGKIAKPKRTELWQNKRVFFVTPQVVQSDMFGDMSRDESAALSLGQESNFPFKDVKLIVVDEAHKAKGRYAYTEVVQAIARHTKCFRVLALSATPGRTQEDVIEVCRNLLINHLEVRCESSIDVTPFVHKRQMQTVVVSLGEQIQKIREQLLLIIDPYLRQLIEAEVLSGHVENMNRNFLLYEHKKFRDRCLQHGNHPLYTTVNSNYSTCISLYHSLELLERHGLRVFLNNFEEDIDGKAKYVLQMDLRLKNLVDKVKQQVGPNPFNVSIGVMTNGQIAEIPKDLDFGHPKFEKARECLIKHFQEQENSRAMVFCEYRESVMLISRMLLQEKPLLRPRCFVGQGGSSGSLRALTQKQQIQIMKDFRSGQSNILIATSIGEEGIDVGEVDLIICFDISTSNPTRFMQRIGRTGRKRNGKVVMLVTEGREQKLLKDVMATKDLLNKKLLHSQTVKQSLYQHSQRLVPPEFKPTCVHTYIKPKEKEVTEVKMKKTKVKANENRKVNQSLHKFFTSKKCDDKDTEFFQIDPTPNQIKPGLHTQQSMENKYEKIKNLFKDMQGTPTTKSREKNQLPKSPLKERIAEDVRVISPEIQVTNSVIDPKRTSKINKFLKTKLTTRGVLSRSEINDLIYHLKSPEMSNEMKMILLKSNTKFIEENLENMKVLNALGIENEADISSEEKSVHEINKIILNLIGVENFKEVESFLQDLELKQIRQQCLVSEVTGDSNDMKDFKQTLDQIFEPFDNQGMYCDNYDYVMEEFRKTSRYQEFLEQRNADDKQQSSIYDTIMDQAIEDTLDYSPSCSKYCQQWSDNIKYESTPLAKERSVQKVFVHEGNCEKEKLLLNQNKENTKDDELTDIMTKTIKSKQSLNDPQAIFCLSPITVPEEISKMSSLNSDSTISEFIDNSMPGCKDVSRVSIEAEQISLQQELDVDLDAFLEPFPEEELFLQKQRSELEILPSTAFQSPDLFSMSNNTSSSVSKVLRSTAQNILKELKEKTPTNSPSRSSNSKKVEKFEKSPSVVDIYLKNARCKGKIRIKKSIHRSIASKNSKDRYNDTSSLIQIPQKEEHIHSKRKIFDSDEEVPGRKELTAIDYKSDDDANSDVEEIPATQMPQRKRRRFNMFIMNEAAVSGPESSENEAEVTADHYVQDSIIVVSDEENENAVPNTQMKAVYLQSLKYVKSSYNE